MDYSKMGGARKGTNKPRHAEHNARGSRKNPFGAKEDKAALLKRMKEAAEKAKKD